MFFRSKPFSVDKRGIETTVHLRDVITVLTVTIAVASAFFMYGTRLSLIEKTETDQQRQIDQSVRVEQEQTQLNIGNERELSTLRSNIQANKDAVDFLRATKKDK